MADSSSNDNTSSSDSAAAAAATSTTNNDDAALAKRLTVLDQLTTVYGFEAELAQQALDAVGGRRGGGGGYDDTDVNACYNYILDQGLAQDQGGPVYPIHTCPHAVHRVRITADQIPQHPANTQCQQNSSSANESNVNNLAGKGNLKGETNPDGSCPGTENWLCVTCGALRCSRYVNGHGLQHWQETKANDTETPDACGHCIAVSLSDLSVWCHVCNSYIINNQHLGPLLGTLEQRKFPEPPSATPTPPARGGEPEAKRHRSGSVGLNSKEEDDKEDEQQHEGASKKESSEGSQSDNDDDENPDEQDGESFDGDENALYQMLAEVAASQGIPLQWILSQMHGGEPIEEDTGPVEYPFDNLPKTLPEIAEFILSGKCQRILVLAGAGMSVASGIPDFRSANGLYATLNVNRLTCTSEAQRDMIREDPSVALDQHLFLENPLPCLESQREFILGTHAQQWKATLAHRFVELLHHKTGKLVRWYTQNIDGLEDQCTHLPNDKVICVHGSMDRAECARCESSYDFANFCDQVQRQIKDLTLQDASAPSTSTPITCNTCQTPSVKPAIVLFRSSLPKIFFEKVPEDVTDVDLLIVIGTSLKVAPANSLVWRIPRSALRLLVNRETVGEHLGMDFGEDAERDVFAEGDIENVLLDLVEELGWLEDLRSLLEGDLPASSTELLRARLEACQSASAKQED